MAGIASSSVAGDSPWARRPATRIQSARARFAKPGGRVPVPLEETSIALDVRHAVVVGCDGQPESDAALRFAVREAALRGARLVVVTSFFRPIDPDLDSYDTPESELRARAVELAERSLCRALSAAPEELPVHQTASGPGLPSRVLLHDYGDAELIVLGSHHRNLLRRALFGHATSRSLIHRGHAPVVVVPPDWIGPTAEDDD